MMVAALFLLDGSSVIVYEDIYMSCILFYGFLYLPLQIPYLCVTGWENRIQYNRNS